MRETLLFNAVSILKSKGFNVSTFLHTNTCFDIAARQGNTVIVLKVLSNIDSFREEQAEELEKVAALFNAQSFIIGEKTKVFSLQNDLLYERYGINTVTVETFKEILDKHFPSVKYFKGKEIVELHSDKIKSRRKSLGLSVSELAEKASTTAESIMRYEKGHATTINTAQKLESILGTGLIRNIDIFEGKKPKEKNIFSKHISDPSFEWMEDLGLKVAVFKHAPFRVFSEKEEELLVSKAQSKGEAKKKAIGLAKTKKVFSRLSFILAKGFERKSISHIPIIEEDEISTVSKFSDLLELVKKREKEKKS